MQFAEAVAQLRYMFEPSDHNAPIVWIAPSDVAIVCGILLIRPCPEAQERAEALFAAADQRGLGVALEAVARIGRQICCYVTAPTDADDAARKFVAPPVTLKVRQDLWRGHEASALEWWLAQRFATQLSKERVFWFFGYDCIP